MIDDEIKNEILNGAQQIIDKWKQKHDFTEPRQRMLKLGKYKNKDQTLNKNDSGIKAKAKVTSGLK